MSERETGGSPGPEASKPPLIVLVGPTAVGKTKLSISIAKAWNCEILSGDSMQVYRGMDIGTAKIRPEEMEGIPHHFLDIVNPDETFNTADFQKQAGETIEKIASRGKLPFLVGGTGLYIESLIYGYEFSEGGADEAFRREQQAYLIEHGEQALHDKLREIDPVTADRLHPNDHRRVIRALEVTHLTGIPQSEHLARQRKESPYRLCLLGLTMERETLYKRIEDRVDLMLADGFEGEVRRLLAEGYGRELPSMQGLGYKEMTAYLAGESSLDEAVALLKRNTRRFAKRQLSWFRHMKEISWVEVDGGKNFSKQMQEIDAIIAGKINL
ncbi:tRNA (adenosine(37)-N6)-dimethylallyltransferase MiaA [Gorillibacterium timonense]|uniref:tRNA (adenosine(37)-N6)-dimethylallyltransferase MiaA n=1 Tax=Gorillibacterium timonense TaxID=1689269 RepID=UPI00071C7DDC|nr:tRNA (adenosine(37)-N6)-dimethylallyltransferase MiaA [Gorillibacterium timonense]